SREDLDQPEARRGLYTILKGDRKLRRRGTLGNINFFGNGAFESPIYRNVLNKRREIRQRTGERSVTRPVDAKIVDKVPLSGEDSSLGGLSTVGLHYASRCVIVTLSYG